MTNKKPIILLIGPPRVGKTTLLRSICQDLQKLHKMILHGFYTEEVRVATIGPRIGFGVVTLQGRRGILASENAVPGELRPRVGKYLVHVSEFEGLTLPLLRSAKANQLLVIDEIGTMELKSKRFEQALVSLIDHVPILATVPFELRQSIPIVEQMKTAQNSKVFEITKDNREKIKKKIINALLQLLKK